MEIRRARPADIDEVKILESETGLSPWSIADYRRETNREESTFLVAEVESAVAGFVIARLITITVINAAKPSNAFNEIEILSIAVRPKFQRQHIAKRFLTALLREFLPYHQLRINLEVRSQNTSAIRFYEASGFAIVGARRNYYTNPPDDALLMRLDAKSMPNSET